MAGRFSNRPTRFRQRRKSWRFQQLIECRRSRAKKCAWLANNFCVRQITGNGAKGVRQSHPVPTAARCLAFLNTPHASGAPLSIYPRGIFWDTKDMKYLLAIVVLLMCGCRGQTEGVSTVGETRTAAASPAASGSDWKPVLTDLQNHELRPFEAGAKGIVLVFVLQDCPIANSYMPELNRLHESFASRGIPLFIVETDPQITLGQAREHAEQFQIKLPVVVDAEHKWVQQAGATKTPEAVVFSPGGEILYRGRIDDRYVGLGKRRMQVTAHDLENALEAILADKPVPQVSTEAIGCFIPELPKGEK